ncbi:FMN-dependent NADH-azoreductase [Pseudomonas sp. CrR25]|nr:FMN-dependent NADH-azoreductase [Pseudomonas sp. CrR25]
MKKILAVNGSPRGARSHSRRLLESFLQACVAEQGEVELLRREVGRANLPHVDEAWIAAAFHPQPAERPAPMQAALAFSDELVDELFAADRLVIAAPMYNFAIPSGLKAWVDQIVRIGRTFDFIPDDPQQQYRGRLHGKSALIITSRGDRGYSAGGVNAALNHADVYLRAVLGLIGIERVEVVAVEHDEFGGLAFADSYRVAEQQLAALAAHF